MAFSARKKPENICEKYTTPFPFVQHTLVHPGHEFSQVAHEILNTFPEQAFCFLNVERLRQQVEMMKCSFEIDDPRRHVAYAMKANPRPEILQILNDTGISHFDCASLSEIENLKKTCPDATALFNHPIKKKTDITAAAELGVTHFTVQDLREVTRVFFQAGPSIPAQTLEVTARLRTLNKNAKINLSEKFGASIQQIRVMLRSIRSKGLLPGISMHTGSQNHDPESYGCEITKIAKVLEKEGQVHTLNLGGGFPVAYYPHEYFDLSLYFASINQALRAHCAQILSPDGQIFIEPGRALIAEAIDLLIPVLKIRDRRLYFDDGVFTSFSDAAVHGWRHHIEIFSRRGRMPHRGISLDYALLGRTCDSGDILPPRRFLNSLRPDDYLHVPKAGAYTDSQSSFFNGFEPPWYVLYNSQSANVRAALSEAIAATEPLYVAHPLNNSKVTIRNTEQLGRGVFAQKSIKKDEIIAVFEGDILRATDNADLPPEAQDYTLQIGPDTHIYAKGTLAELLNHSCEPNCGIRDGNIIKALRSIRPGEQLCWDYSTAEDLEWRHSCECGADSCRRVILPFRELADADKKRLWPIVADWIRQKYGESPRFLETPELSAYEVQNLTSESPELTDEVIREITDFFFWIFANEYSKQFLFYPSEGAPISPQQALGVSDEAYVSLEELRSFAPKNFPLHPDTGEEALLWMAPEITFKKFKEKFARDAHITLLRKEGRGEICGLVCGRKCSLQEAFEAEEWKNPHCYSLSTDTRYHRDFSLFLSRINTAIAAHPEKFSGLVPPEGLSPASDIYVWNCFALAPELRGIGKSREILKEFFALIPSDFKESLVEIGEPLYGSVSYQMFHKAGAIDIPGVLSPDSELKTGNPLLIIVPLKQFAQEFSKRKA